MTRRIVEQFAPEGIILFGSRVRGDARPDSDYDLLVVFDQVDDRRKMVAALRGALADLSVSKDVIVATADEIARGPHAARGVLKEALGEGRRIYARR